MYIIYVSYIEKYSRQNNFAFFTDFPSTFSSKMNIFSYNFIIIMQLITRNNDTFNREKGNPLLLGEEIHQKVKAYH